MDHAITIKDLLFAGGVFAVIGLILWALAKFLMAFNSDI